MPGCERLGINPKCASTNLECLKRRGSQIARGQLVAPHGPAVGHRAAVGHEDDGGPGLRRHGRDQVNDFALRDRGRAQAVVSRVDGELDADAAPLVLYRNGDEGQFGAVRNTARISFGMLKPRSRDRRVFRIDRLPI